MKKFNFIIAIFVLLTCSCSPSLQKEVSPANVVDIDISKCEDLDAEKYFDKIRYVALETTTDALIGEFTKIYLTDGYIVVFDQKSMAVFLFGADGKFIRKIGEKDEGPDEYLFINDIQFDKEQMLIFAHERFQNCIYTYDLEGNLLDRSQKAVVHFNSFFKSKEGVWVYSCFSKDNPEHYNLTLLSADLQNIEKQYFPQSEFVNVTFSSTFVCDGHGRVFFYYPSSNIIHEIIGTDVEPFLQVDFGDATLPYDRIVKTRNMEDYDKLLSATDYLGNINRCFVNRDRLFFSFSGVGLGTSNSYNCYYDLNSGERNVFSNPFMQPAKYPISTNLLYATDTILVYPVYPSIFSEDSFVELSKQLSTDIQFDSNPILAICPLMK
ncbi:6-bladed beta-propeller [Bacteroides sp. GD17]|jgi:hypothetical protein|uniref:6-bladed beta-propeller n=1 Tax=Bacteroides sp. GD17 TaxID=3139826 RepID=UPI0025CEF144|nr:6-bladed beta-propeller [uncultured Bacteroides sp.]